MYNLLCLVALVSRRFTYKTSHLLIFMRVVPIPMTQSLWTGCMSKILVYQLVTCSKRQDMFRLTSHRRLLIQSRSASRFEVFSCSSILPYDCASLQRGTRLELWNLSSSLFVVCELGGMNACWTRVSRSDSS